MAKMPGLRERHRRILESVTRDGVVSVNRLVDRLRVSPATVRRDLAELEQDGLLRRTHGGATNVDHLFYDAFQNDPSFQEQVERNAEEKRRIGMAAAAYLVDVEL